MAPLYWVCVLCVVDILNVLDCHDVVFLWFLYVLHCSLHVNNRFYMIFFKLALGSRWLSLCLILGVLDGP